MTQAIKDALADAETFLRVAASIENTGSLDARDTDVDFGGLGHGYGVPKRIRMGQHNVAARYARIAAHAAFQAVPELRA